jgi:prepilin-type N-terminal cleavage/methylation domain-containing protein
MQRLRNAFTMLELVFVIIIMGIVGTIGVEIFRNAYDAYMSSAVNQKLQSETELALKQIANRLQYRFKDSIIARKSTGFVGLSSTTAADQNYTAVEWVGYDIDGWLGTWDGTAGFHIPTWSGFIDVDHGSATSDVLVSPGSDLRDGGRADTVIDSLGGSRVNNCAIFFTGANTNVQKDYGWDYSDYNISNTAAHPINYAGNKDRIATTAAYSFTGMDVYEQYKLAWTAYALVIEDGDGDGKDDELNLYYDYQPWEGDTYDNNGTASLLVDNVTTFKFQAIGDILRVQLCVDNNATGNIPEKEYYSLCKEKVIF